MTDQDRLRRLFDALPSHVVELNADLLVVDQNHTGIQLSLGRPFLEQIPHEEAKRAKPLLFSTLEDAITRKYIAERAGRQTETQIVRIEQSEGSFHLGLITTDITESISLKHQLAEDEAKLDVALDATKMGLWRWNLKSNTVIWDSRMREITGVETPLTLPEWIEQLTHPDDRETLATKAQGLTAPGPIPQLTSRILRPDGQVRWVMSSGVLKADESGQPEQLYGGTMDVTDQKRVAEQLQAAERMQAMGHLTAGVAHNFNNMLMVIGPCLDAIGEVAPNEVSEDVRDARNAADRAAQIVQQLMAFAGQINKRERETLDARTVIEDATRLCQRSIREQIEVRTKIETDARIHCAPGSIEQVISNVIFNARDALLSSEIEGAKITVVARDTELFDERWVELVISDNGPGIPHYLRSKIFEPFVTTKNGKGTGLGLASSQAIVEQHGGQLAYREGVLAGAEFLILLPAFDDESAIIEKPSTLSNEDVAPRPRQIRVLIVEDERSIRRVICRGLMREGYLVREAECEQTLEILFNQGLDFDFVLLDRSLRRISGSTLIPALRKRAPAAKIFYFTGEHVSAQDALSVDGVIQKPLNMQTLTSVIKENVQ